MFKKGDVYSTDTIVGKFGGSKVYSMPIVGGQVPYCKFTPKINPNFESNHEVWIEEGPILEKGADLLAKASEKVHVFKKLGTGQWEFLGMFNFKKVHDQAKLQRINKNPPRKRVACILKLVA